MKKNFNVEANCVKVALICALLYVVLTVGICGLLTNAMAESYPLTTVVVEVNHNEDVVVCMDFNGHEWAFEGCEDWYEGDVCSMTMDDHDTDIIFDDEIITARYDGWIEGWMERVCD